MWFVRLFSLPRICQFVEPQTFSFSRKREASVALACETEMNIEGLPVKAVPDVVRNRPTPQKFAFPERYQNVCEAERRRHHQKGRLCNTRRRGLVHQRIHQV